MDIAVQKNFNRFLITKTAEFVNTTQQADSDTVQLLVHFMQNFVGYGVNSNQVSGRSTVGKLRRILWCPVNREYYKMIRSL